MLPVARRDSGLEGSLVVENVYITRAMRRVWSDIQLLWKSTTASCTSNSYRFLRQRSGSKLGSEWTLRADFSARPEILLRWKSSRCPIELLSDSGAFSGERYAMTCSLGEHEEHSKDVPVGRTLRYAQ